MGSSLPTSPVLGGVGKKIGLFFFVVSIIYIYFFLADPSEVLPPEVLHVGHQVPTGHSMNGMKLPQLALSISVSIKLPQEGEEWAPPATTARLHLLFRNTLVMCMQAFPQLAQFNATKQDLYESEHAEDHHRV